MTLPKTADQTPLSQITSNIPQVGDALGNWQQTLVFGVVTKTVVNGQAVETQVQTSFRGVIQPLSPRQLMLKPEGQRAWSWYMVHADPTLNLKVDSVIVYRNRQFRVMGKFDFSDYGYVQYEIQTDYTGSGPGIVSG